jgi:hypothetical protein
MVLFERGDPTVMWHCGSVGIMQWSNEQRAFAVEAYFSKKEVSLPHPVLIPVESNHFYVFRIVLKQSICPHLSILYLMIPLTINRF